MSCSSCSNTDTKSPNKGCKNNGSCSTSGCDKLEVYDWLGGMQIPNSNIQHDVIEVRFKNGRKGFYRNLHDLELTQGEVIAVEASPGHDIGIISLTGELVSVQMKKKKVPYNAGDMKKVYRIANQEDIDKWHEARALENKTMLEARKSATKHELSMKISDVEYQGDKTKATFYYTADERVDFRVLIKDLAEQFKIRVEMRQIGARQEAGRLGGIGSCGRELCCSTWLTDFRSVSTTAARYQQLSLNPQKLAGQCGKLKCCLNYELDMYLEAYKGFPETNIRLETKIGRASHFKTDIFKKTMWYIMDNEDVSPPLPIHLDRVLEIIEMNKKGKKPESLNNFIIQEKPTEIKHEYSDVVGQDSLERFDKKKPNRSKNNKRKPNNKKASNTNEKTKVVAKKVNSSQNKKKQGAKVENKNNANKKTKPFSKNRSNNNKNANKNNKTTEK